MDSLRHVVFLNLEATGHMNPTLPLVAELKRRGCHVTYFVGELMRPVVEAAGATWRPYRNSYDDDTGIPKCLVAPGVAKYVPEGTPPEEYASIVSGMLYTAELLVPALLEDMRKMQPRPSLIVYDPFIPAGPVAAHVLGVPAATLLTMPGPGVMAKPSQVIDGWEAMPWVQGPREELVRTYGYDAFEHGILMEFYSPVLNLVTTIDELYVPPMGRQEERFGEFPFKCVGVLTDSKVKRIENANISQETPQMPVDLAELDRAIDAGRQVLYISLGTVASSSTFWNHPFGVFARDTGLQDHTGKQFTQHVFRCCFEALGSEVDDDSALLVVLSTGAQEDALEGLPSAPANFRLHRSVPQLEVLRRSSAFVTHCGANSMHEALSLGVPMAAVPIFGDQPLNADSLSDRGVAIAFKRPMEAMTNASLRQAIEQLTKPGAEANTYRAAAHKMAQKLQASKSVSMAVDLLLGVAAPAFNVAAAGGA